MTQEVTYLVVRMEHPSKFSTMCISQYLQSVGHHIYILGLRIVSILEK